MSLTLILLWSIKYPLDMGIYVQHQNDVATFKDKTKMLVFKVIIASSFPIIFIKDLYITIVFLLRFSCQ